MLKKNAVIKAILFWAVCLSVSLFGQPEKAEAKSVSASAEGTSLRVGKCISIKTSMTELTFKSSNSETACVSKDGRITGKKPGKVKITVSKKGYTKKTFSITVKKSKRKPTLPVAMDEVELKNVQMLPAEHEGAPYPFTFSAKIKNTAKKGTVKKIVYQYRIDEEILSPDVLDEEGNPVREVKSKTVVLTAKSIKAGKTSARVSCEGDYTGDADKMQLEEIRLYTGEALYTFHPSSDSYALSWGVPDKKAPVISGWVKKKSIYNQCPLLVCYSDRKSSYNFKKHVSAEDARDGKTKVTADASAINWKKTGIYRVYYHSKDSAGNTAESWAKVQVYAYGEAERMADIILSSITKPSWTDEKKLRRIYAYVKGHCSYTGSGTHSDWRAAAVKGIKRGSGDCFTFYAVSRLLITRAGIMNIEICRFPAHTGYHHWWNLVYVRGGWYHFDTTPRRRVGKFCLVTDEQLHAYSAGGTFRFREPLYPKRAKKKISPNP